MKPIKMTESILKEIVSEFSKKMENLKMYDGKISYETSYTYVGETNPAQIDFTRKAWEKMTMLIQHYKTEVAWNGIVERDPEDDGKFIVQDIIVYPQLAGDATVDADEERYPRWILGLGEVLNKVRLQGHSHQDMGVSPSGVDRNYQKEILSQVGKDDYYIFMIWNRKLEWSAKIFDLKFNILYETKDIIVTIEDEEVEIKKFLEEAKKMVKIKPTSRNNNKSGYSKATSTAKAISSTSKKDDEVEEEDEDYLLLDVDDKFDYFDVYGFGPSYEEDYWEMYRREYGDNFDLA